MPARWTVISILLLALIYTPQSAAYTLRIRDSATGLAVSAARVLVSADVKAKLEVPGRGATLAPKSRDAQLSISAPGYRDRQLTVSAGADRDVTVFLDPVRSEIPVAHCSGLSGHVIDATTGLAVEDAVIEGPAGIESTAADGWYCLGIASARNLAMPATPLTVSAPGHTAVEMRGLKMAAGTRMPIYLKPGSGQSIRDMTPQPVGTGPVMPAERNTGKSLPAAITDSIRVGFSDPNCSQICCTGSCSNTCVFSLETYVRRGLNDEWIASWGANSLAAGAVAYRSFGAWHTGNPVSQFFDVCSSSCCQVNDPDTHPNSDAAVGVTAGITLTRNGQVFRAEYAAENNAWDDPDDQLSCSNQDLSCGDGSVGSPALGWPCLIDDVGLGHGCFGHGRGMSQRGSHRWERDAGADWVWILDHYYNDSDHPDGLRSARIAPVLGIAKLIAEPRTLRAGQMFQIRMKIRNAAAELHSHVLLGASVRRPPGPFVDDTQNDQAVSLAPGWSSGGRAFALPYSIVPGDYDLYVAVYIDVNQDGQISGIDLRQDLIKVAAYLHVSNEKAIPTPQASTE